MSLFEDINFDKETVMLREQDEKVFDESFLMVFPIMGHYMDALFATDDTLKKRTKIFDEKIIQAFNPPKFTAGQHRTLYGIFKIYEKRGINLITFTKGIFVTPYELCDAMEYKRNKNGGFNGADQKEALKNLRDLAYMSVDIYQRKFEGLNKDKKRVFEVSVTVGEKILQYKYQAKGVTEEDQKSESKVRLKAKKLWLKLNETFFSPNYFKLAVSNFYSEMAEVLNSKKKRITEYHWTFMLWLLKQNKQEIGINIDKLVKVIKVHVGPRCLSRARKYVRELYSEFKEIDYLLDYQMDVKTKNGGKKDVLVVNPEKFVSLKKRLEKSKEKSIGYSKN